MKIKPISSRFWSFRFSIKFRLDLLSFIMKLTGVAFQFLCFSAPDHHGDRSLWENRFVNHHKLCNRIFCLRTFFKKSAFCSNEFLLSFFYIFHYFFLPFRSYNLILTISIWIHKYWFRIFANSMTWLQFLITQKKIKRLRLENPNFFFIEHLKAN